jgi:uncharacterized protein YjiS (DUF1127 family)
MLLSLIRMIQAFRDYQRNVSELAQLSDRELADIGLDRSDIPRVAAGTYNGCYAVKKLTDERITPAFPRALSYLLPAHSTAAEKALTLRDDWHQIFS